MCYSCVHINILELCSVTFFGNSWTIPGFAFWSRTRLMFSLWLICPATEAEPSEYSAQGSPHPHSAGGKKLILCLASLIPLKPSFPSLEFLHAWAQTDIQANCRAVLQIPMQSQCLCVSQAPPFVFFLVLCPVNSSPVPPGSQILPLAAQYSCQAGLHFYCRPETLQMGPPLVCFFYLRVTKSSGGGPRDAKPDYLDSKCWKEKMESQNVYWPPQECYVTHTHTHTSHNKHKKAKHTHTITNTKKQKQWPFNTDL